MVLHKLIAAIVFLLCVSPLASSKIIFTSDRDGDDEIYVMDDDGTHIQRLTHHPDGDGIPIWSSNGKQIAFTREKRWHPGQKRQIINICVMYPDGSELQQITDQTGIYNQPRWSPDGKHIAFSGDGNIHTIDMETQEVKTLLRDMKGLSINNQDWSPDGKSIAYTMASPPGLQNILYTTDPNGSTHHQLLPAKGTYKYSFQWSSDGRKSVYCEATYQENDLISNKVVILGKSGLLLQKIDMTGKFFMHSVRWMGDHHLLMTAEVWSPPNLPNDIYHYTLATGKITNLTNHPSGDSLGDWIDDAALAVLPAGKLSIVWGQLKKP